MKPFNKDIASFFWLVAVAGAGAPGIAAQAPRMPPAPGEARALQAEARKARLAVTGKKDQERIAALKAAVTAYDKVRTACAGDSAAVSEAAFRLGELYLRLKDTKRAIEAFGESFAQSREKFGARALMEIAHVERRSRRLTEAIAAYERVEKEFPEDARATDARLWIGKTEMSRKAYEEARKAFRQVASSAKDPVDRVEGYDWIARSFLKEQRVEEAEAALRDADEQLGPLAASDEPDSGRVRSALERMGARSSLARVRAKQAGETVDADPDDDEETGGREPVAGRGGARDGGATGR